MSTPPHTADQWRAVVTQLGAKPSIVWYVHADLCVLKIGAVHRRLYAGIGEGGAPAFKTENGHPRLTMVEAVADALDSLTVEFDASARWAAEGLALIGRDKRSP